MQHLEVKKFAHHVDNAKFLHEQQIKLQKIMDSIDGYIRLEGLPSEAQEVHFLSVVKKVDPLRFFLRRKVDPMYH